MPPSLFTNPHPCFDGNYSPKKVKKSGERWARLAEKHLWCSSGLPGLTWMAVSMWGAFIQHYTILWSSITVIHLQLYKHFLAMWTGKFVTTSPLLGKVLISIWLVAGCWSWTLNKIRITSKANMEIWPTENPAFHTWVESGKIFFHISQKIHCLISFGY